MEQKSSIIKKKLAIQSSYKFDKNFPQKIRLFNSLQFNFGLYEYS